MADWYGDGKKKDGGHDGKKESVHERHARERGETHDRHAKARAGLNKLHEDELAQLAQRQDAEQGAENTSMAEGNPQAPPPAPAGGAPAAGTAAAAQVSGAGNPGA